MDVVGVCLWVAVDGVCVFTKSVHLSNMHFKYTEIVDMKFLPIRFQQYSHRQLRYLLCS